ncbi:hypothetical protein TPA0909_60950 [Streptomyces albus]|nr:hypothetical protein TPA0909_60950 [Streptomyces albus]
MKCPHRGERTPLSGARDSTGGRVYAADMTDPATPLPSAPLATGPRGMRLLSFHREPEDTRFPDAPVAYVLLAVRHEGRLLMVHVRSRSCWELPGGGIEEGETPRQAAARELREETGQVVDADALRFAGFSRTALGPGQRVLYGAVFTGALERVLPFTPSEEISAVHWRTGDEPLPFGEVQTGTSTWCGCARAESRGGCRTALRRVPRTSTALRRVPRTTGRGGRGVRSPRPPRRHRAPRRSHHGGLGVVQSAAAGEGLPQLRVPPAERHQFGVRTVLHHLAVVQDDHPVGPRGGGQPVCDHQRGAGAGQPVRGLVDQRLGGQVAVAAVASSISRDRRLEPAPRGPVPATAAGPRTRLSAPLVDLVQIAARASEAIMSCAPTARAAASTSASLASIRP